MNVVLKPRKEKPIIQNHPWIFSGAIQRIDGEPQDGDIVNVVDSAGNFLAKGYLNRKSQITVRILTRDKNEAVDSSMFKRRITNAVSFRRNILDLAKYDSYRLIHDSADLLPGLIVDKYTDYLVVQILTLGMEKQKGLIADILQELLSPKGIYERSDSGIREKEGIQTISGVLRGQESPDRLMINQNSIKLLVDVKNGQKTGAFLDQRENVDIVALYAKGKEVLDCFCYTGSFSIYTAAHGAKSVTGVDTSVDALELAQENVENNHVQGVCRFVQANVFDYLESCNTAYNMIILDPPGFAKSERAVSKAARAYKHINMTAMKLLKPGGILATFSCSHHVDPSLFRKIVFGASVDAGCNLQIIRTLHAAQDHPINVAFPEGEYLKGLLCYKMP